MANMLDQENFGLHFSGELLILISQTNGGDICNIHMNNAFIYSDKSIIRTFKRFLQI